MFKFALLLQYLTLTCIKAFKCASLPINIIILHYMLHWKL